MGVDLFCRTADEAAVPDVIQMMRLYERAYSNILLFINEQLVHGELRASASRNLGMTINRSQKLIYYLFFYIFFYS